MESFLSVEELHQIRYNDYENTKDLSHAELIEKTNKAASIISQDIKRIREENYSRFRSHLISEPASGKKDYTEERKDRLMGVTIDQVVDSIAERKGEGAFL